MMSAILIRGLAEAEADRLKQEAVRRGVSVNAVVKQLIREGLGLARPPRAKRHLDLEALAGTWSVDDANEFEQAVEAFEQVEPEVWR